MMYVSIHASVKDATLPVVFKFGTDTVSIHASVKDATETGYKYGNTYVITVSIHASVKDATDWCRRPLSPARFNPRICKRCDSEVSTNCSASVGFNPRICKRCDRPCPRQRHISPRFNPRICKRCDQPPSPFPAAPIVSIHASVKDATGITVGHIAQTVFQSTHL